MLSSCKDKVYILNNLRFRLIELRRYLHFWSVPEKNYSSVSFRAVHRIMIGIFVQHQMILKRLDGGIMMMLFNSIYFVLRTNSIFKQCNYFSHSFSSLLYLFLLLNEYLHDACSWNKECKHNQEMDENCFFSRCHSHRNWY